MSRFLKNLSFLLVWLFAVASSAETDTEDAPPSPTILARPVISPELERQSRRLSLERPIQDEPCDCRTTNQQAFKQKFKQYDPNMSVFIIPVEKPRDDRSFKAWGGKKRTPELLEIPPEYAQLYGDFLSGNLTVRSSDNFDKKDQFKSALSQEDGAETSQTDNSSREPVVRRKGQKFLSWGGKRSGGSFGQWGGKRSYGQAGSKRAGSFNNWGGKRSYGQAGPKRAGSFNNWGGKRLAAPV